MQSPPAKVQAAMPGTLRDLSQRTGYPIPMVAKFVIELRRQGVRVNAVRDPSVVHAATHGIGADDLTTIFEVDSPSREE